jgi:WD40 repeat protein
MSARRLLLVLLASSLAVPLPATPSPPQVKHGGPADALGDPLPAHALFRIGTVRFRHGAGVTTVFVAPDGKTVLSAGEDSTLRVWDIATGKEFRHWRPSDTDESVSSAFAISPDGKRVAYHHFQLVCVCDALTGRVLNALSWEGFPSPDFLSFMGESDALLCAQGDTIHVLRADTGEELRCFPLDSERSIGQVQIREGYQTPQLALSADGSRLLSAQYGRVWFWDVSRGKKLRKLGGNWGKLTAVALSRDHRLYACGNWDGELALGDTSGRVLQFLTPVTREERGAEVTVLAFSPDAKQLACGDGGGAIRIYESDTGKQLQEIAAHGWDVQALAYTADGRSLVSGGRDGCVRVWDVRTGREQIATHLNRGAIQVALSADGTRLATAGTQQPIHCWEAATGKEFQELKLRGGYHYDRAPRLFFSADGSRLRATTDRGLRLWDVDSGGERRQVPYPDGASTSDLSPDGRFAARWSREGGKVTLVNVASPSRRWAVERSGTVHSFLFSADAKVVGVWWFVPSDHGDWKVPDEFRVFETATGKELHRIPMREWTDPLAFTPDKAVLITGGELAHFGRVEQVRRWVVESRVELPALEGDVSIDHALAVSPDGKLLVVGDSVGVLTLWELATGKRRGVLKGHIGGVDSLAFSADGKRLASGSWDTTALLWDLPSVATANKPMPKELTGKELDALWADLRSDDAAAAYRAVALLAAFPKESVPYLRERVTPVRTDPKQLAHLLAELDDASFETRKMARAALAEMAEVAEPALRAAAKDPPSPEVRRSVDDLLEKAKTSPYVLTGERLRAWRALDALEMCGTAEACDVLATLAQGDEAARLTREAKMAVERLRNRGVAGH